MKGLKSCLYYGCILLFSLLIATDVPGSGQDFNLNGYVVGPGDVLQIQVWDHEDLNRNIQVSQDGSFSFPFIGKIDVTNRGVNDIAIELTEKLSDGYLVAPQITVRIVEYNNKKVFLFGEVLRPGTYPLKGDIRLLELISEAGGFTEERGMMCHIVRSKGDTPNSGPISIKSAKANEILSINLNRLTSGKLEENIKLQPGDSIYVNATDHIFVTGEVRNPGEIKWTKGMTVRQAISSAGGGTASAAINRTSIVRLKDGQEVELTPGLSDPVSPDDIIKVPESYF